MNNRGRSQNWKRSSGNFPQHFSSNESLEINFSNQDQYHHSRNWPLNQSRNLSQNEYRTFYNGHEEETNVNSYQSISEQKIHANQSKNRRYNKRRYPRNYRSQNFNRSNERFNSQENLVNFASGGGESDTESISSSHSSSCSSKASSNDQSIKSRFESGNWQQSSFLIDKNKQYLSGSVNINNRKEREDYGNSFCDISAQPNSLSLKGSDRLADLRNAKKNYDSLLSNVTPSEIIMDYRQEVDDMTKECIKQNLRKMEKIYTLKTQKDFPRILNLHSDNLLKQQKQFEDYITQIKVQFSSIYDHDTSNILKKADYIKFCVQNECSLFRKSLPGYAVKSDLYKEINENQMLIILADSSYFLNRVVPVMLQNLFPEYFFVSCESSDILSILLEKEIQQIFNHAENMDFSRKEFSNVIHFMTEKSLLSELINGKLFCNKNLFVVLNLALKRSITTDILLATLRDHLQEQKKTKIVLLLPQCDDSSKYQEYFSKVTNVSLIKTPSLILPIRTFWRNGSLSPTDNYKDQIILTVLGIHALSDLGDGDILAFVPSLTDAKSISVMLNQRLREYHFDDVECILLHDGSSVNVFSYVCGQKNSMKRRVFLATDCAEMLVIPSVQHVIDSGIKKEFIFDHRKCFDVLTTTFISRSKAMLRKSLAGVYSSGCCYRLYNKENFCKDMLDGEYPEVFTVNPFNTMIKFFQYQSNSASIIDLVEPLPEEIKNKTMDLLKKCNALKDGKLTALGKDIVKLPFPAKYSKFILLGIQWGLAYEAAVLVGFFSVKARVFKYHDDEESQRRIDAVKLQLIQCDSDTLSYLFIFKIWKENDCNPSWCDKHFINHDTLNQVNIKVMEICHTVGECLNENIAQEFCDNEIRSSDILEMLFECFHENLSVFTGHYRSGFRVLSSGCIAFLHPSSVMCQKENLPRFLIFDHMISTSRDFLVDITSIPYELVMNSIKDGIIDFDHSDMFEKGLVQEVIEPVGEKIIKQVLLGKKGHKLFEIEDEIKKAINCEAIVIEPSVEKGCVIVYTLQNHMSQAVKMVKEILKNNIEDILNAQQVNILHLKKGEIKIPIEIKWVKGAKATSVQIGSKSQGTITIQNNLTKSSSNDQSCAIQCSINLTWTRRVCCGKAYVNFTNYSDFSKARKYAMKPLRVLDSEVFVQVSKLEANQLFITEVPEEAKAKDLEDAFESVLSGINIERVELKFVPPFETSENELQEMKTLIQELCEEFTDLSSFTIVVPKPKASATLMKAYINMTDDDGENIELAAENLCDTKINSFKVTAIAVYRSIIKCSLKVCEFLQSRFKSELSKLEKDLRKVYSDKDLFSFDINDIGNGLASIKLLSNHYDIVKVLQRIINEILEGEVLTKSEEDMEELHKLFCHGGHVWLRTLEKVENLYILEDYKSQRIRLYGPVQNCIQAKRRIVEFLEDTENEAVKTISLSSGKNSRALLKAIIVKYGANLENFIEEWELRSAVLDIKSCRLLLLGNRENIEKAEDCLKELSSGCDICSTDNLLSAGEICPVCYFPALNLTYRLEYCGHLYCRECIQGLVEQADFPIQCCEENCYKDIVLDDIRKVLGDDTEKINTLLENSMKCYLEDNKLNVGYCPAPDCSMFYYKNEISSSRWNCPLCQNDICISCNTVYHHGYTCEMYQNSKQDPDYSFKIWKKTSTLCKQCPNCKTAIEKNEGCDHMTCASCHAHFCWVCLRKFPSAGEVYNHIPFCDRYPRW